MDGPLKALTLHLEALRMDDPNWNPKVRWPIYDIAREMKEWLDDQPDMKAVLEDFRIPLTELFELTQEEIDDVEEYMGDHKMLYWWTDQDYTCWMSSVPKPVGGEVDEEGEV